MLKKSYKVLDIFVTNPTITYLFNDVKRHIGSKSESYTYNSLKSFVKEGILTKDKRGGVTIYKIADSHKAILFLSMAAQYKAWNKKLKKIYFDAIKTNVLPPDICPTPKLA